MRFKEFSPISYLYLSLYLTLSLCLCLPLSLAFSCSFTLSFLFSFLPDVLTVINKVNQASTYPGDKGGWAQYMWLLKQCWKLQMRSCKALLEKYLKQKTLLEPALQVKTLIVYKLWNSFVACFVV